MSKPDSMKKSEKTKQRLLEAATAEFAAFGFSGARVDRIADTSGCNKQAIYAYFGSKDDLFEAVYNEMVVKVISSVPMDAKDLPNYAASLAEHFHKHPEVQRLASWYQLEKAAQSVPAVAESANKEKIAAISAAQKAGVITNLIPADRLLGFILGMARSSSLDSPSPSSQSSRAFRKALVEAVERLVHP